MTDLTPHWNRVARLEDVAKAADYLMWGDWSTEDEFAEARSDLRHALNELDTAKPRSVRRSGDRSRPRPAA